MVVDPACDGFRLDRLLSQRIRRLSRSRAARLKVFDLDGQEDAPLKKSARVRAGQRLWARRPLPDAGLDAPEPAILYEDDELLVLDKPAGLATHPTASRFVRTVTYWLAGRAEPVHRLDVETTGVLVAARTAKAARFYKSAFARGAVEKTYWAIVRGAPGRPRWTCDTPLGFAHDSAVRLKMGRGETPAVTDFTVLRAWTDGALIEARPRTGRQHQIRAHLAICGSPVLGDKLYGPDERLFLASLERPLTGAELERLGHERHALHAARLEMPGRRGERLVFEAPWPADLARWAASVASQ